MSVDSSSPFRSCPHWPLSFSASSRFVVGLVHHDEVQGDNSNHHLSASGCGSKLNHQGTAGFSPCFLLTRLLFWVPFLTQSHLIPDFPEDAGAAGRLGGLAALPAPQKPGPKGGRQSGPNGGNQRRSADFEQLATFEAHIASG